MSASSVLLVDFYQLTMMDSYYRRHMEQTAVFEFYVRRLPEGRSFLLACGLEQVLDYLEALRFTDEDLVWIKAAGRFSSDFIERLADLRFTGEVMAMREGTVFFENEPVLRVMAPLPEAQLVESRIVNILHLQTLVASKAARCRIAAGSKELIDFGMRRAHGAEAALLSSRASYIAGFDATATVEASRQFGIPVVGTMAHSYIQAHTMEVDAFRSFTECFPDNTVLLIDTYDTARAAKRVAELAAEMQAKGLEIKGVRIDSGDLGAQSLEVRRILDEANCKSIKILASGGIDERLIDRLIKSNAPIDTFCVGTRLSTSEDAPVLDCAYKLQQYAGQPCRKRSPGKETWPGPRQVYRQYDSHGRIGIDFLACADEVLDGEPLLHPVMIAGRRLASSPSIADVRRYCAEQLSRLPLFCRSLEQSSASPVEISSAQHLLAAMVDNVPH